MAAGTLDIQLTGSTQGYVTAIMQAGTVTEQQAQRMVKQLQQISRYVKDASDAQAKAASAASVFKKTADEADKATGITAGFTRELIVLGHEATQGNFSRMGGSMLVLAERSAFLTKVVHSLISPIGLVAGAVGGFIAVAAKGAHEQDTFNKSLVLTNNYAGVTASRFQALADSVAKSTDVTIGAAKEAAQSVVASGLFSPKVLDEAVKGVTRLSHFSGQTVDEVVKDFSRMHDGVAKWAEEQNRTMHFLTASQYEYIRTLEEQGKAEDAERFALKALNDQLASSSERVGFFARAWLSVKEAASSAMDSISSVGKDKTTAQRIAEEQEKLHDMLRPRARGSSPDLNGEVQRGRTLGDRVESQRAIIAALEKTKAAEDAAALAKAEADKIQADGIAARSRVDALLAQKRGAEGLRIELERLSADFEKAAKAGKPFTDAQKQDLINDAKRHFQDPGARKIQEDIRARLQLYSEESARLKDEQDQYERFGRVVEKSAEAVARIDIGAGGKFAAASVAQKKAILEGAIALDKQSASEIAAKNNAETYAQSLKQAAEHAKTFNNELGQFKVGVENQIKGLQLQTQMIGMDDLARQKLTATLKLEDEARKLAEKNPFDQAEIWENEAKAADKLTQAIEENYKAQRTWSAGSATAFQKYADEAANASKYAEQFVGGSIKNMEDWLVKLAETGKTSFASLFKFMADEFLRQQARMLISGGGGYGGGLLGLLGLGGKSGSTPAASPAEGAPTELFSTPAIRLATGTNYVPRDNMPALLHEGEAVVPKAYNPAAGGSSAQGVTINQTNHIGAGVNRAEMMAGLAQVREATKADILSSMNHNGIFGRRSA